MTWSRVKPRSATHGAAHDRARKAWAARHHPADPCARCGHELGPMGPGLHLDHDDYDKSRYIGFSHSGCNLRAAGQLGRQRQEQAQMGTSRIGW